MGSLRTPVGPLPSSIYWRRRAVVLLPVVIVVLLIVWALRPSGGDDEQQTGGHDDGNGGPAESITPGPTPSESFIDERPGGRDTSSTESGEPGDEAGAGGEEGTGAADGSNGGAAADGSAGGGGDTVGIDPAGLADCLPADVSLTLSSAENDYSPEQQPRLLLTAHNESGSACRLDLGYAALTVTLADAADEQVWSSADCPEGASSDWVGIAAGGAVTRSFDWDRRHSTPQDCDGPAGEPAAPGTYLAEAQLTGFPVVQTPFLLDED
ncbi:hypothetical protein [Streptomyces hoynatensis]|uniref:DUF4232 domain-containing protein n=1 Tax=Streptomyces hoynatensis TaxID=1141874 RepID=A0A3A9Z3S7_9ACTN|nr:hypothetical protein [Streptomyces hoynatensis]RKN42925.1 hypothetical protein D7294_10345 [Streptomyces hoynatensis]